MRMSLHEQEASCGGKQGFAAHLRILADWVALALVCAGRQAQEILPNLFVGPYQSSNNLDLMQAMGLTHVLCLQDAREA